MKKTIFAKAFTTLLLMFFGIGSANAYYEHFSLLGMGSDDWSVSSTARPIDVNLNNTTYNEYFRVLYLTAGDYYFALTSSLNNGDPNRYGPVNDGQQLTIGGEGVFGTYTNNTAWKVTIVEEGYYRLIVNEAAGNDENKEWYPTVRIEKNDLKLHAGFYGWDNREMKRVGDTYTYLCEGLAAGDNKEFVIRGGSNYQYYYTTNGVSVDGSELAISKTSDAYPNFNFTVTEPDDYVISVQVTSENTVKVNVKKQTFEPSVYTEYNMSPADKIESNQGTCSPLFTWETDNNGDVIITISAGEGTPGATMFRGAGMKSTGFKLNKSADDFVEYFDAAKVDDYTYKLAKKKDLPEGNNFISFNGQIECKSSINGNDWSTYVFEKYTYGTKCEQVEDTQAPTNFTASVKSVSYTSVVLSLFANDDHASLIKYTITDQNDNVYTTSGVPGQEIDYTVTGLALNTQYTFSVVAEDQAENETEAIENLVATTLNGPAAKTSYFVLTGTKENMPGVSNEPATYEFYLSITRNSDFTLSSDVFVAGDLANATGLGNGSISYRGADDWSDYTVNPDGTRTRQTSKKDYAASEGQDIECFLHFAYANGGLCQPFFHYVVGSEANNTYTLNGQAVGEWYTICLPFDATIEGAKLYSVSNVVGEKINLTEANKAEAGKAYLYQPTATTVTATYTAVAAHQTDEYMKGNLSATALVLNADDDVYILDIDNKFHHIEGDATATVGQYKAYLKVPAAAAKTLVLNLDDETAGISNITIESSSAAYNLAGQRVAADTKGIVIINGKKVLNK